MKVLPQPTSPHPQDAELRAFLARNPAGTIGVSQEDELDLEESSPGYTTIKPHPNSLTALLTNLNSTALSQHVLSLMNEAQVSPEPGLLLLALLAWARENLPGDRWWMEHVYGLACQAGTEDPDALYYNLQDAFPRMLEAQRLPDAADALLALMADLIPAN